MPTAPSSSSEVFRHFMNPMEPLNYDAAWQLVAADCEYTNPSRIGTVHGSAGIRAALEPFFRPTTESEFRIPRESASGNLVFLERRDRHLFATRWVELPVTSVYPVHDGSIAYRSDDFDAPTIRSQSLAD